MRVLVVDDSAFMRRALSQMLSSAEDIEVVGSARNGREGLEMAKQLKPDVITLDIEMPEMDGLTALQHIMHECPTQVLMLSSLTTEGSHAALRALSLGAADVLAKDASQISLSITKMQVELIARVRALGSSKAARFRVAKIAPGAGMAHQLPVFRPGQFDVVCIGSSTGGPPVLEAILGSLPESLQIPIVVAQHMPAVFTKSMSQRLDELCALRVLHIEDGMPLERRTIYIAPGGKHTHIDRTGLARWKFRVDDEPAEAIYRPGVDALFESAASAVGGRVLGIVLTGMGNDGMLGGQLLHKRGATLIAQNADTCVVYGMPKGITEQGLVAASLPPEKISQVIKTLAQAPAKAG